MYKVAMVLSITLQAFGGDVVIYDGAWKGCTFTHETAPLKTHFEIFIGLVEKHAVAFPPQGSCKVPSGYYFGRVHASSGPQYILLHESCLRLPEGSSADASARTRAKAKLKK